MSAVGAALLDVRMHPWFAWAGPSALFQCLVMTTTLLGGWCLIDRFTRMLRAKRTAARTVLCLIALTPVILYLGVRLETGGWIDRRVMGGSTSSGRASSTS